MKYFQDSKDLNWLGAPAFFVIVLVLLLTANKTDYAGQSQATEKISPVSQQAPAVISELKGR